MSAVSAVSAVIALMDDALQGLARQKGLEFVFWFRESAIHCSDVMLTL